MAGLKELVGFGRLGQGQDRLEMDAKLSGISELSQGFETGVVRLDGDPGKAAPRGSGAGGQVDVAAAHEDERVDSVMEPTVEDCVL